MELNSEDINLESFGFNVLQVLAVCGPYTIVFFTIVVFFGSFYLINLMLAVVARSYQEEAGEDTMVSSFVFFLNQVISVFIDSVRNFLLQVLHPIIKIFFFFIL